jgi:hypothetical protein
MFERIFRRNVLCRPIGHDLALIHTARSAIVCTSNPLSFSSVTFPTPGKRSTGEFDSYHQSLHTWGSFCFALGWSAPAIFCRFPCPAEPWKECGLNDSYPMTDVPVARSYLVRELFLS